MLNKVVIITGSSSGIGKGCRDLFSQKGWDVIGIDIKGDADFIVDVSSSISVSQFFEDLSAKSIKVDAIINNAAIQIEKKIFETDEAEWDKVLDTNLKSVYLMTKFGIELFSKEASIINISSVHAKSTSIGLASYVASKGGVSALTRAMALELADKEIRVNSILPGAIETPMLEKGLSRNSSYSESKNKIINSTPSRRIGLPADIAKLALFLASSEESSFITGQEFICDGGVTAKLASE